MVYEGKPLGDYDARDASAGSAFTALLLITICALESEVALASKKAYVVYSVFSFYLTKHLLNHV